MAVGWRNDRYRGRTARDAGHIEIADPVDWHEGLATGERARAGREGTRCLV